MTNDEQEAGTVDEPVHVVSLANGVRVVPLDQVKRSVDGATLSTGHVVQVLPTDGLVIRRLDSVAPLD